MAFTLRIFGWLVYHQVKVNEIWLEIIFSWALLALAHQMKIEPW